MTTRCAARSPRQGAQVALYTSRFAHGAVPAPVGYERRERFYRGVARIRSARARRAVKLLEHVPDMLAYRRAALEAQLVHFQWLAVQQLDARLLPTLTASRPLAAHRPRHPAARGAPRPARRPAPAVRPLRRRRRALPHGARRLVEEVGLESSRVHVIPHGALTHLADAARTALPFQTDAKVVLCFGLMRPYKGLELLLDAWGEGVDGAELWLVGMPRMDISALRARAPASVRWLARYVDDEQLAACFQRAELVVLPYRQADQSGVLFTALAFGKPLLLSDVGGFPEVAEGGAARCFPAGDAHALREALGELLADPAGSRD